MSDTRERARDPEHGPASAPGALADRALALCLCLPSAVLLAPGALGPLSGDPAPELAGSGWALAASIPALAFALVRPPARAALRLAPWLVVAALAFVRARTLAMEEEGLDTLEAERALFGFTSGTALLLGGMCLGAHGRRALSLGLAALTLAGVGGALVDAQGVGPLGNAGELAETAVLGAAAGALVATGRGARGAERALGAAAALAFALFALSAPSILGVLALAGALGAAALLARDADRAGRGARLGAAALLVVLLPFCVRPASASEPVAPAPDVATADVARRDMDAEPGAGDTGGIAVRRRVWAATLDLVGAHAWLGVGPGQFARAFPPFRDPEEIELSTHGRRLAAETEVEHPHDDLLLAAAELGVPGGVAFALFLALVLAAAVRGMRGSPEATSVATADRSSDGTAALGAAALAVLACAAGGGALLDDPASSSAALAAFGALLGVRPVASDAPAVRRAGLVRRLVPLVVAGVLTAQLGAAARVIRHGRALRGATAALAAGDGARLERALEDALAARGDSALALGLRARLLEATLPAGDERTLDAWRAVLALRPARVEALVQIGVQHARRDEVHDARTAWRRALELDPGHPGAAWNLARLELGAGRATQASELLDDLERRGRLRREALERLAIELLLRGRDREAMPLAARAGLLPADADPVLVQQRAERARDDGDDALADALTVQARRGFAREHAEAGRWHDAVRLYRVALAPTTALDPDGALPIRLELAAAALADGDETEARERVGAARPSAADWAGLPAWAGERLRATGWFDGG